MVSFLPKRFFLDIRTYVYDYVPINGNELLKKLKKLAKERQVHLELIKAHGKGSHSTLKFGANKTTIKDLKKEIGPGLLKKILDHLGINKEEI